MTPMRCPKCNQQVAPNTNCWFCGTYIPRSARNILVGIAGCISPVVFCLLFGGVAYVMETIKDRRNQQIRQEREAKKERGAAFPAPPRLDPRSILRPAFQLQDGEVRAGTAFLARHPDLLRPVVLSALHLLGPAGGLPDDVPPTDLPKVIRSVTLTGAWGKGQPREMKGGVIPIPGSAPMGKVGPAGDILAVWAPATSAFAPLRLAMRAPAAGDPVWLAAEVTSIEGDAARLHPARIRERDPRTATLSYVFEKPVALRGTSGAPVLNAAGEVVGIHLGGSQAAGKTYGVANPVPTFLAHLLQAARRNPPPR